MILAQDFGLGVVFILSVFADTPTLAAEDVLVLLQGLILDYFRFHT